MEDMESGHHTPPVQRAVKEVCNTNIDVVSIPLQSLVVMTVQHLEHQLKQISVTHNPAQLMEDTVHGVIGKVAASHVEEVFNSRNEHAQTLPPYSEGITALIWGKLSPRRNATNNPAQLMEVTQTGLHTLNVPNLVEKVYNTEVDVVWIQCQPSVVNHASC